ncbi:MAG: DUF2974 domain-containing protein [Termitinemataceae bacterium]|nr:MAG: DUF2974 domain-containing protein [Termitinemataceae bacterium]
MANVFDYLKWRGDLSFSASPFNPVDNIIFSIISYYPLDNIVPQQSSEKPITVYRTIKKLIEADKINPQIQRNYLFKDDQVKFMHALLDADRYKDIMLHLYENKIDLERQLQFSALLFIGRNCLPYIAFRGTDASIVGWKEDFNMIFKKAIPAQIESVAYIEKAANFIKTQPQVGRMTRFNVGGHSKGGNLAVYAAAFCKKSVRERIETIFNNDAPGFSKETVKQGGYKEIQNKICSYIPQDSIIGLLFEHQKKYFVVQSAENGFMQHNPFSWQITRDNMCTLQSVTPKSKFLNRSLMKWLDGMDQVTRVKFINTLYDVLNKTNAKSIPDLTDNWLKNTVVMIKSMNELDKESREMFSKIFAALVGIIVNNVKDNIIKPAVPLNIRAARRKVINKLKNAAIKSGVTAKNGRKE